MYDENKMPLLIDNVNTLVWDTKENPIKIQYFDWLLGHNPFNLPLTLKPIAFKF